MDAFTGLLEPPWLASLWLPSSWLPWSIPGLYLLAALITVLARRTETGWRLARGASLIALLAALCAPALLVLSSSPLTATRLAGTAGLVLVTFLGWVIVRFSGPYLAGEPCQKRFLSGALVTLAGAALVSATDHLAVLALAWSATGLGLHRLLTLYPHRPGAQRAARKHFVSARLADLTMLVAVVLIARDTGTLSLSALSASGGAAPLTAGLTAAAVLLAITAIIRCAQLPLHGWVLQVMEAPTPVSALLHAGVVNLGGLVLIKMAWLINTSPAAQWLLLLAGGLTTAIAALAMIAQSNIKVRLAWSTCAQMGFMLVECALGAWHLALLHLLGHSLYKAFAFLNAGDRVMRARRARLSPKVSGALSPLLVAALVAVALLVPILHGLQWLQGSWAVFALISLIALTPLLAGLRPGRGGAAARTGLTALAVVGLGLVWHRVFGALLTPLPGDQATTAQIVWITALFVALLVLQARLRAGHHDQRLHRALANGLYLDQWINRLPGLHRFGGQRPATPAWREQEHTS
ncbi:NADH-quinone oxidoreductase subunit L [Alloalcanivorax gelatiniphagus]|uniref:Probable inorganic carbon transporter subunit DabB n=3 Tax=Alloalcanivorax gelatiniphagus TaxID=1194167 RepID=A0ABY2XJ43_9GAMM|nr:NADH-quinone oxidoreductase subunit L [Alloalcanivorax gelatiniphagus]TMW11911.1 NADH-quinone oxidoreductase subunit L [Alloalcanivorax gelatiniphagus]